MSAADPYQRFLEGKIRFEHACGFDIAPARVHPMLKPHQRDCVVWAVKGGRRALFESFGLGKSMQQIEVLRLIVECIQETESGFGRALIIAPLGVRQEFKRDGLKLGQVVTFIRSIEEAAEPGLYITNYETVRDGKLDPNQFDAVSLDEADCLRSYGSKTFQTFLTLFAAVRFRFVATATPSPNHYKELIHYAGFLGVMDTGQALTRFFKRDSTQANNLTLYAHKEAEFWRWLATWAIFLQRPSDLGHSDEGYDLPPLRVIYHEVKVDHSGAGADRDGQGLLFKNAAFGVSDASREKRDTMPDRIAQMLAILQADPDSNYILWHDLEDERRAIEAAVPSAISIYGSQDLEEREQRVIEFSDGAFQYLSAKPSVAGAGCNFQRFCHKAIFLGIGFKFRDFIQSIHRIQRFLQAHPVEIHIIYAESEREILRTLQAKWEQHNRMVDKMSELIREYGLSAAAMAQALTRSIGVERIEARGTGWLAANNDCVRETRAMDANSVDLIVTSIPFANHYEYTPSFNDFGHTDNNDHFWAQMDFLTPELLRILKPGRIYCCHTKDRINFGNVTGAGVPTVSPFHAEALFHGRRHGFDYLGMITVVTDVVRENNQTYRLGWSEQCKDATKMGVGSPEYILIFHKPQTDRTRGYADVPVVKSKAEYTRARWQVDAHAFWRSNGNRFATAEELAALPPDVLCKLFTRQTLEQVYSYEHHVKIGEELDVRGALPSTSMSLAPGSHHPDVWHDVNRMLTLNGEQSKKGLEAHVCPLQFDIVDRLICRYSNPGELVFDPFGGLATVPYRALHNGRQGRCVELNTGYFLDGVKYLEAKERELSIPDMFATIEIEQAKAA